MHSLIALLLVKVIVIQAVSYQALVEEQWQTFKLEHGKFYQTEEEESRRQNIFMENLHKITEHNKLYEMGLTTYKLGINHFADLTEEEFLELYTIKMPVPPEYSQNLNFSDNDMYDADGASGELYGNMNNFLINEPESEVDVDGLPTAVDWRSKGAVTAVKNQGQCGSCWSFSATGALEAQWFRKTGRLISLSEQNLIDCSWRFGNHGCNGGWMTGAFHYIKANGGIDTEQSYPYQARIGYCHYRIAGRGAVVRGVVQFIGEGQLQSKVTNVGPIAVAIEVGHSFHLYHSGVYNEPRCGRSPNHAVLVVGYGSERGGDYWLVKNSWGANWGDRGYIKMSRNRNNQCGIASYCSYPLV